MPKLEGGKLVSDLTAVSGLPLCFDNGGRLGFNQGLPAVRADIRFKNDLLDVLHDQQGAGPDELYYMYRGVARAEDRALLQERGLRYDVTVIRSGTVGREYIKTAGHYHPVKPGTDVTYPEVYEVLLGCAHYLLQTEPGEEGVEAILVEAKAGDKVLIPPGYGHITVNPGPGLLIMSNWVADKFASVYEPIRELGGGAFFELVGEDEGSLFVPNPRYKPAPGFSAREVRDWPEFGLESGRPMYISFLENPVRFAFLTEPENFY